MGSILGPTNSIINLKLDYMEICRTVEDVCVSIYTSNLFNSLITKNQPWKN
jgi:hypothetical protein